MAEAKTIEARFVEAWGNIENPELDSFNPHYKNRYASLKETQRVIREACKPLGLMYQQKLLQCEDGQYRLYSFVRDADGGTAELSTFPVENVPNSQAFGSEMTYKKRQQAQADWGIVGEEDEDGEAATEQQNKRGASKPAQGRKQAPSAAPKREEASTKQGPGRWDRLSELKAQALELGITEDGMKGAMNNVLQGKPLKDATDQEIKVCEGVIATLIGDKKELMAQVGGNDGGQH